MSEEQHTKLYHASPSKNTDQWYVWDIYTPLPPKPVYFGSMEEAISVSDQLNMRELNKGRVAPFCACMTGPNDPALQSGETE